MSSMRRFAVPALVGVALISGLAHSQAPSVPTPSKPADAVAPAVVKRSILADGAVLLQYEDGTTRRVSPSQPSGESPAPPTGEKSTPPELAPVEPPEWLKDAPTNASFLEAMREYYAYRASGLRHRARVFEWQLLSSRIIFATVLGLVASGIVFAAVQFGIGLRLASSGVKETATEIDLSTTSVKVSSPVLGVIILVISLVFFYLYLVYVYPINEIV